MMGVVCKMGQVDLVRVRWIKPNGGEAQGYFIKQRSKFIRVAIFHSEIYNDFPEGAKIEDVELNVNGVVAK